MTPHNTNPNQRRRRFFSVLGIAAGFLSVRPVMSLSFDRRSPSLNPPPVDSGAEFTYKMSSDGILYRRASDESAWETLANFGEHIRLLKVSRSETGTTNIYLAQDFNVFLLHSEDGRRWRCHNSFRRLGMKRKPLARTWA